MVDEVANAVMYEGYLLYPYRATALKNRHRFNFGVLAPRDACGGDGGGWSGDDSWFAQTECLVRANLEVKVTVRVRFLHLLDSKAPGASQGWQEAVEREVSCPVKFGDAVRNVSRHQFAFMASVESRQQALNGQIDVSAEAVADGVAKLLVVVSNLTASRELPPVSLLSRSFVSTHAILDVETGGEFVSMTDPPAELALAAAECRNIRLWPVLAGDASQRNTVLASPIILYDYPQIAPESAGDFFDGTEIDEMLALRVLTMTDEEKDQARRTDPRARLLVDRTEALSDEQLLKLHGVLRGMRPVNDGASR
jgi:hypothetical protein